MPKVMSKNDNESNGKAKREQKNEDVTNVFGEVLFHQQFIIYIRGTKGEDLINYKS